MHYHWSEHLKTGHEHIDHQHEELFELVSMLDLAIQENSTSKIESLVQFLEHYVETHFAEEETLMNTHHYAGYDIHKEDHEIFKARVFSLRHDLNSGVSPSRLIFAIRMFIDKLVYHIQTIDIGIASLYHQGTDHETQSS
jgi:hemerythrin